MTFSDFKKNYLIKNIVRSRKIILIALLFLPVQSVNANGTTSLVFVTSEHCPFCKAWEQQVGQLYDQTPYGKNAPLRRIDISKIKTELPDLSPQVIGTPTFIILELGQEIGRIRGFTNAEMFYWQLSDYVAAYK